MPNNVTIIDHPLVQHKLTGLRRKDTQSADFRRLLREISLLMAYEVTQDLALTAEEIETPLARCMAPTLKDASPILVSILRAGNVLLEGMLELLPSAPSGHIGLYRDPASLVAVEYYCKLPEFIAERLVIVVDPMLATGNTAIAAVDRLKNHGVTDIRFVCLLATEAGLNNLDAAHADVPVLTAAIDEKLDDRGYIVPGLGDAGDRLYGTR
jgi:uracil phosphoribosyltransferase